MALFNLENEFNKALKMDGPISKGPVMRWQRKLNDTNTNGSGNSSNLTANGSLLQNLNFSNAKSPSRNIRRSLSLSSIQNSDNGSAKSTPSRRSRTPGRYKSPAHSTAGCNGDRFIASRSGSNFESAQHRITKVMQSDGQKESSDGNGCVSAAKHDFEQAMAANLNGDQPKAKILAFKQKAPSAPEGHMNNLKVLYSQHKTPASSAKKFSRHIPSAPDRVLDAPDLRDDYYLNLISWSASNMLAVPLRSQLYIWNSETGDINQLMQVDDTRYISSVSWVKEGSFLAVGLSAGAVEIWDVAAEKRLRTMDGHDARVGSLSWNEHNLSSGCRTGAVHHHDVRVAQHLVGSVDGHTQEVCGLRWSPDGKYLASGGNDNLLNIWSNSTISQHSSEPLHSLNQHQAAVKALAWCPWQPSLLASGGGTADRCIKFWNCNTGVCLNSIDTKSQVCSILWSREHHELISGHGFPDNRLTIWKYPTLHKVTDLLGHTSRVLDMALSPDGSTVVSAAADETLRLWSCFQLNPEQKKVAQSKKSTVPLTKGIR